MWNLSGFVLNVCIYLWTRLKGSIPPFGKVLVLSADQHRFTLSLGFFSVLSQTNHHTVPDVGGKKDPLGPGGT